MFHNQLALPNDLLKNIYTSSLEKLSVRNAILNSLDLNHCPDLNLWK